MTRYVTVCSYAVNSNDACFGILKTVRESLL